MRIRPLAERPRSWSVMTSPLTTPTVAGTDCAPATAAAAMRTITESDLGNIATSYTRRRNEKSSASIFRCDKSLPGDSWNRWRLRSMSTDHVSACKSHAPRAFCSVLMSREERSRLIDRGIHRLYRWYCDRSSRRVWDPDRSFDWQSIGQSHSESLIQIVEG